MAWPGRVSYVMSPSAPTARLGNTLVPLDVQIVFTGADAHPNWMAHFRVVDGRPECLEVRIEAKEGGRGIRTADVNLFNLDAMAVHAFSQVGGPVQTDDPEERHPWLPQQLDDQQLWQIRGDLMEARQSRRGGVTKSELEEVAEIYLAHVDRSPTATVARLKGYSMRTAARRVDAASAAGLLPTATQGKKRRQS